MFSRSGQDGIDAEIYEYPEFWFKSLDFPILFPVNVTIVGFFLFIFPLKDYYKTSNAHDYLLRTTVNTLKNLSTTIQNKKIEIVNKNSYCNVCKNNNFKE